MSINNITNFGSNYIQPLNADMSESANIMLVDLTSEKTNQFVKEKIIPSNQSHVLSGDSENSRFSATDFHPQSKKSSEVSSKTEIPDKETQMIDVEEFTNQDMTEEKEKAISQKWKYLVAHSTDSNIYNRIVPGAIVPASRHLHFQILEMNINKRNFTSIKGEDSKEVEKENIRKEELNKDILKAFIKIKELCKDIIKREILFSEIIGRPLTCTCRIIIALKNGKRS